MINRRHPLPPFAVSSSDLTLPSPSQFQGRKRQHPDSQADPRRGVTEPNTMRAEVRLYDLPRSMPLGPSPIVTYAPGIPSVKRQKSLVQPVLAETRETAVSPGTYSDVLHETVHTSDEPGVPEIPSDDELSGERLRSSASRESKSSSVERSRPEPSFESPQSLYEEPQLQPQPRARESQALLTVEPRSQDSGPPLSSWDKICNSSPETRRKLAMEVRDLKGRYSYTSYPSPAALESVAQAIESGSRSLSVPYEEVRSGESISAFLDKMTLFLPLPERRG